MTWTINLQKMENYLTYNKQTMVFKESHLEAMKYLQRNNELNKENIKELIYNYSVQTDKFILILDLHKLL